MQGQEKEERRLKWREGVGERGREKEVGESESLLGEERGAEARRRWTQSPEGG